MKTAARRPPSMLDLVLDEAKTGSRPRQCCSPRRPPGGCCPRWISTASPRAPASCSIRVVAPGLGDRQLHERHSGLPEVEGGAAVLPVGDHVVAPAWCEPEEVGAEGTGHRIVADPGDVVAPVAAVERIVAFAAIEVVGVPAALQRVRPVLAIALGEVAGQRADDDVQLVIALSAIATATAHPR